ncbi:XdhC/CoxI family protein [Candidatus Kuenenia sp.]|uniref:XdhC/CoxI family protein n=1 Tax=Candidatus Kuenenia sp. TaxID=2499824 RepID=UPI00321FD116
MYEIFKEILRLAETKEPCVLVTVVCTKGSTPQKDGAKMLILKDGSSIGALGGGCIEGEIWSQAKQLLKENGMPVLRTYDLNEEFSARDGMVCGGTMSFFIDPLITPHSFEIFAKEILLAYEGYASLALATVVNDRGGKHVPGAKFLVKADGTKQGSLGSETLEREAIGVAGNIALHGEKIFFQASDGTDIYIEGFRARPALILIGGGHVNRAVSRIAAMLDFDVFIVDDRKDYVQKEVFPAAKVCIISNYRKCLENIPLTKDSYIVVATRGHRYDDLALFAATQTQARFIGLLGSKRKSLEIFKSLLKEDASLEKIKEIHAPIGLNIGAVTPEEIAVSIMAEIIMIRYGGDGGSLKMQASKVNANPLNVPKK